jgi:hypothetical protein
MAGEGATDRGGGRRALPSKVGADSRRDRKHRGNDEGSQRKGK